MRRSFQRFFRPISELGIHLWNANSAKIPVLLPQRVAFFLCTFRFAPAEQYETYTIL